MQNNVPSPSNDPEDIFGSALPSHLRGRESTGVGSIMESEGGGGVSEGVTDSQAQPGEKIYMHEGVVWMKILQSTIGILLGASLLYEFINILSPSSTGIKTLIIVGSLLSCIAMALYAFKAYENSFFQITRDSIINRQGWIPSYTDTIFWINIKDINSSVSIPESFLSSGTIILVVGIRNEIREVKLRFVPQHEKICNIIRNKIGSISAATRQVSYT
jgi:hypothetical protein